MRHLRFWIVFFYATAGYSAESIKAPKVGSEKIVLTQLHLGFLLSPIDSNVTTEWQHESLSSTGMRLVGYWNTPVRFGQFQWLVGGEFDSLSAREKISSSRIVENSQQLRITNALLWQPKFWQQKFSLDFHLGFRVWSEVLTKLETSNYVKKVRRKDDTDLFGMFYPGFTAFYDVGHDLKVLASLELIQIQAILFGVQYGF